MRANLTHVNIVASVLPEDVAFDASAVDILEAGRALVGSMQL